MSGVGPDLGDHRKRRWRWKQAALWMAILAIACVLRLPAVGAGLPYLNYVDEGHVLHRVEYLLSSGGWDPRWYTYPTLPVYSITAANHLLSPVYTWVHGHPLRKALAAKTPYYDVIQPPEILVVGRFLTLLVSLGIVVLSGLLARRLGGTNAGFWAAFTAAAIPALVIRGGIVIVDTYAAFFVLAALYLVDLACTGSRPAVSALLAGTAIGFAFTSKYPAALVFLAAMSAILLAGKTRRARASMAALTVAAAVVASVVAMPTLLLKTDRILAEVQNEATVYAVTTQGSFWKQAIQRAEWDQPLEHPEVGLVFLFLAAFGLVDAMIDRTRTRRVAGWIVYGGAALFFFTRYPYRPFRTLLPLVAVGCVLVGLAVAALRQRSRRPVVVGLVALVVLSWSMVVPSIDYAVDRLHLKDSRKEAMDWLVRNSGPCDTVLFSQEMAFLPQEMDLLKGKQIVAPLVDALSQVQATGADFLVLGVLKKPGEPPIALHSHPALEAGYERRAQFGDSPIPALQPGWWRGNRQLVYILESRFREAGASETTLNKCDRNRSFDTRILRQGPRKGKSRHGRRSPAARRTDPSLPPAQQP